MAYNDLIQRLRCPADRGELAHVPERVLVCKTCKRAYPIREGVPVMLVDEHVQAEGQRILEEARAGGVDVRTDAEPGDEAP